MQSPLGAKIGNTPDNSFEKAGLLGTSVADIAIAAIRDARAVQITDYDFFERMVRIPIANKGFDQAAKLNLYRGRIPPMTTTALSLPSASCASATIARQCWKSR